MCIACKVFGKRKITEEVELKKALATIKELYLQADDEMLAHLDALAGQWLMGPSKKREPDVEDLWEKNHRS